MPTSTTTTTKKPVVEVSAQYHKNQSQHQFLCYNTSNNGEGSSTMLCSLYNRLNSAQSALTAADTPVALNGGGSAQRGSSRPQRAAQVSNQSLTKDSPFPPRSPSAGGGQRRKKNSRSPVTAIAHMAEKKICLHSGESLFVTYKIQIQRERIVIQRKSKKEYEAYTHSK
jgi:hypothetical protein